MAGGSPFWPVSASLNETGSRARGAERSMENGGFRRRWIGRRMEIRRRRMPARRITFIIRGRQTPILCGNGNQRGNHAKLGADGAFLVQVRTSLATASVRVSCETGLLHHGSHRHRIDGGRNRDPESEEEYPQAYRHMAAHDAVIISRSTTARKHNVAAGSSRRLRLFVYYRKFYQPEEPNWLYAVACVG